jgi:hypothetical protein
MSVVRYGCWCAKCSFPAESRALVGIAAEECGLNQAVDMGTCVYAMFPLDYRMEVLPSLLPTLSFGIAANLKTSHALE